jgi:tetratricopeptide (TPR) repeat protein
MRFFIAALFFAASAAFADDAPAAPAPPADPLAEPHDLVESQANTKGNLQKAIGLYDKALTDASIDAKKRALGYSDEARAYLRLGDLETQHDAKIAAYTKGREAAQKGSALDPKCAECLYWDMANQAVVGRTNGVMNSLFMLGDLRKGLNQVLALDPGHKRARETLAKIDHAVPGIAGGSDDRAEKALKDILAKDPHFTPAMATLAQFYADKGKKDDAKALAQRCMAETASSVPNDFRKFDKNDCAKALKDASE